MIDLDPVLARQLKKLTLEALDHPPDLEAFTVLIQRVNETYKRSKDDRDLLARSLDLSTAEMTALHSKLSEQRDKMEQVVIAVSDALSVFHDIARVKTGQDSPDVTSMLSRAKRRFATKMAELFGQDAAPSWEGSSDTSGSSGSIGTSGSLSNSKSIDGIRKSFLALADQLAGLLQETAQVAAMRKELEVAGAVQQMLLPPDDTIDRKFLRLAASFQPAAECGGDWWTAHDLADGRMLVVIGDVTGHGISSAIITGAAKGACDVARHVSKGHLEADSLLEMMNGAIAEAGKQRFMMSAQAVIFDPERRKLTMANAGHGFAFLVRGGSLRPIVARGSPLGSTARAEYPVVQVDLERDDMVVLYTDGVTECEAPSGEQYSEKRFRLLCGEISSREPRDARTEILRALRTFRGDRPMIDDITFVIVRIA